jgi:ActR/RegA family two-component response regulator
MPKLIHVVDDDSSFRTAIQRRLLKAGYEVEIAVLPRRAFLLLAHFRPHAMSDLSPLCAPKRTSSGGNARAALAACTDAYACLLLRGNVTVAHGEPLKLRHPIVCPGLHDVVRMERQQGRVRWLGGGT